MIKLIRYNADEHTVLRTGVATMLLNRLSMAINHLNTEKTGESYLVFDEMEKLVDLTMQLRDAIERRSSLPEVKNK